MLVWDSGVDIGDGDVLQWIDQDCQRRMKNVSGVDIDSPRIFKENGSWVFSGGEPSNYSIPDLIDETRTERIRQLGGE